MMRLANEKQIQRRSDRDYPWRREWRPADVREDSPEFQRIAGQHESLPTARLKLCRSGNSGYRTSSTRARFRARTLLTQARRGQLWRLMATCGRGSCFMEFVFPSHRPSWRTVMAWAHVVPRVFTAYAHELKDAARAVPGVRQLLLYRVAVGISLELGSAFNQCLRLPPERMHGWSLRRHSVRLGAWRPSHTRCLSCTGIIALFQPSYIFLTAAE